MVTKHTYTEMTVKSKVFTRFLGTGLEKTLAFLPGGFTNSGQIVAVVYSKSYVKTSNKINNKVNADGKIQWSSCSEKRLPPEIALFLSNQMKNFGGFSIYKLCTSAIILVKHFFVCRF